MSMSKRNSVRKKNKFQRPDWRKFIYQKWIVKNIPFFLFLAILTIMYIANGHYADKTIRKINSLEKHLKEMEYEFKTVKRNVMFRSKESELVKENPGEKQNDAGLIISELIIQRQIQKIKTRRTSGK